MNSHTFIDRLANEWGGEDHEILKKSLNKLKRKIQDECDDEEKDTRPTKAQKKGTVRRFEVDMDILRRHLKDDLQLTIIDIQLNGGSGYLKGRKLVHALRYFNLGWLDTSIIPVDLYNQFMELGLNPNYGVLFSSDCKRFQAVQFLES